MSRDQELYNRRNKKIKEAYEKLAAEQVGGARPTAKYKHAAILSMLSDRFFLTPDYIQNLLCAPDPDQENPNQIKLFE